jgi:hypothetical protein
MALDLKSIRERLDLDIRDTGNAHRVWEDASALVSEVESLRALLRECAGEFRRVHEFGLKYGAPRRWLSSMDPTDRPPGPSPDLIARLASALREET